MIVMIAAVISIDGLRITLNDHGLTGKHSFTSSNFSQDFTVRLNTEHTKNSDQYSTV